MKKKNGFNLIYCITLALFVFCLGLSFVPKQNAILAVAEHNLPGGGTSADPFQIDSRSDMVALASHVNSGGDTSGKHFKLMCNLDMQNTNFTPIGTNYYFKGVFDGNNKFLSNFTQSNSGWSGDLGVFAQCENATIKNLKILSGSINVSSPGADVGAIVGTINGNSKIENCANLGVSITVTTSSSNSGAGGIVGWGPSGTISRCYNWADVTNECQGTAYAGGILGTGAINISECYNSGTISAGCNSTPISYSGGIAANAGTVTNSYNLGRVVANATEYTYDEPNPNNTISGQWGSCDASINSGDTKDSMTFLIWPNYGRIAYDHEDAYAGGIVWSANSITNCYNTASVHGGYKVEYMFAYARISSKYIPTSSTGGVSSESIKFPKSTDNKSYNANIAGSGTISNCYTSTSSSTANMSTGYYSKYKNDGGVVSNVAYFSYKYEVSVALWGLFSKTYSASGSFTVSWQRDSRTGAPSVYSYLVKNLNDKSTEKELRKTLDPPTFSNYDSQVTLISNFSMGSAYATSKLINDGLPHLKSLHWQDNASSSFS